MNRLPKPKFKWLAKFAAVVLVLNAVVCLKSLAILSRSIGRVAYTPETVSGIERVFSSGKDTGTGARELLLWGPGGGRWVLRGGWGA